MAFNPEHPIVLGLAGEAATGKTTAADGLAPPGRVMDSGDEEPIFWDHVYFAMPIYRMAAARQKIQGNWAQDRIRFEIYDILIDLFGRGTIASFDEFIELVDHISCGIDCEPDGFKARVFMQNVAMMCKEYDPACFLKRAERSWLERFRNFQVDPLAQRKRFGVVISDVRFPNEVERINTVANGLVIRLTVRPEVAAERLSYRDGSINQNPDHPSETALADIDVSEFAAVIDTSYITQAEKVQAIKRVVGEYFRA